MSTVREKSIHVNEGMPEAKALIGVVITVLQRFMCKILAVRIVAFVLLVFGFTEVRVHELTGLCERSTRDLEDAQHIG